MNIEHTCAVSQAAVSATMWEAGLGLVQYGLLLLICAYAASKISVVYDSPIWEKYINDTDERWYLRLIISLAAGAIIVIFAISSVVALMDPSTWVALLNPEGYLMSRQGVQL